VAPEREASTAVLRPSYTRGVHPQRPDHKGISPVPTKTLNQNPRAEAARVLPEGRLQYIQGAMPASEIPSCFGT
jgi:hypothetical protein